jgi:hypothetical protein
VISVINFVSCKDGFMALSELLNQNMYFIKKYFYDHVIFFTVYVLCDTCWRIEGNVLRTIEHVNKIWVSYVTTSSRSLLKGAVMSLRWSRNLFSFSRPED